MERNKIVAILCAIIAFLLVVMAGKSCAESINEANKANRKKSTQAVDSTSESEAADNQEDKTSSPQNVKYDLFGRPILPTEEPTEETQPVTDENGNVIEPETEVETVTDESGNITETVPAATEESAETTEEPTEDGTQAPTIPPGFSGFDHKEYDDEGNEVPTIPPDFVIVIE